jgi:hypothetical protein
MGQSLVSLFYLRSRFDGVSHEQREKGGRERMRELLLTFRWSRLRTIAWNPLGNLVATGSVDKTLRVCEFAFA